ncbi:uncharacterized protein PHALS_05346 [Plasmopara halstedii]|uniref:Uncharacterized protein n=1 Tax=Plasmopara halstedii TaxID=4781 RepID=A0A0P1A9Z4_PLAHL|nr:uncharacterized protein PHALS_05346 [Plasmopara halstedii]CEG37566.1 hypothetical protein PHALS_05346 [Plasmopara halstedii]|eukprot:XP_024573935.1 hypothetical protein PHALS_05346 [Plasmopara halstedii]
MPQTIQLGEYSRIEAITGYDEAESMEVNPPGPKRTLIPTRQQYRCRNGGV